MSALLQQMRQDNPAALWPLTETSGTTAFDVTGNGRNGTYTGTVTPGSRSSVLGVAPDFAGGYVTIPDNSVFSMAGASGVGTLEAWLVADTLGSAQMVFAKGGASNYEWDVRLGTTGTFLANYAVLNGSSGVMQTPGSNAGSIVTGKLCHIIAVYNRATPIVSTYLNGVLSETSSTASGTMTDGGSDVRIGIRTDLGGQPHDGLISHVAYYPTALTVDRIMAHYLAGIRSRVSY